MWLIKAQLLVDVWECFATTRIYLLLRLVVVVCQPSRAGGELIVNTLGVCILWLGWFERVDLLYHPCHHPGFLDKQTLTVKPENRLTDEATVTLLPVELEVLYSTQFENRYLVPKKRK